MKINIAASHRFHLLDLARELDSLGHEVRFYSYVPTKRAIRFGLKKENSYSLYYACIPFLFLWKITKGKSWSRQILYGYLDWLISLIMKPCDIYIALGTVYLKSFDIAKHRYKARTILEWGSKHILTQQDILSEIPGFKRQTKYFINRTMNGYNKADYIAISSDHVKQSFIDQGFPKNKLLQNPYGVDLSMFHPTELDQQENYDLIMVGGWSYRKGCDLLIEFCKKYPNYSLLHVGPIVDITFPEVSNMKHVDAVVQSSLINYYKKAKIFVLPSREEGLAMVQLQALACGLSVVCSKHTGGRDLNKFINENSRKIVELAHNNIEELEMCINKTLSLPCLKERHTHYEDMLNSLSWTCYGKRYNHNIKSVVVKSK